MLPYPECWLINESGFYIITHKRCNPRHLFMSKYGQNMSKTLKAITFGAIGTIQFKKCETNISKSTLGNTRTSVETR